MSVILNMNPNYLLYAISIVTLLLLITSFINYFNRDPIETFKETLYKKKLDIDDVIFFDERYQIFNECEFSRECCPSSISTHDGCLCE
jgi:hypothetical protein